uniref:Uncharacterized protein n=1 Tax=Rhizophora mucronata TaxID=61149 RepID=A0A2P2Q5B5_RHIMU
MLVCKLCKHILPFNCNFTCLVLCVKCCFVIFFSKSTCKASVHPLMCTYLEDFGSGC